MINIDAEFERARALPHDGELFDALPERDRILIAIWGLEAEVNNGGFHQYYFNSAGDQACFAAEALDRINAKQMAAIVMEANAHFADGGPPRERSARQERLFAITDAEDLFDELDQRFYKYSDDIAALLTAYLEAQPR